MCARPQLKRPAPLDMLGARPNKAPRCFTPATSLHESAPPAAQTSCASVDAQPDAAELAAFMELESRTQFSSLFACNETRSAFAATAEHIVRWLAGKERRRERYTEAHFEMRSLADWFLFEARKHEMGMTLSTLHASPTATERIKAASDVADDVYNAIVEMAASDPEHSRAPLEAHDLNTPMRDLSSPANLRPANAQTARDHEKENEEIMCDDFEELLSWFEESVECETEASKKKHMHVGLDGADRANSELRCEGDVNISGAHLNIGLECARRGGLFGSLWAVPCQ